MEDLTDAERNTFLAEVIGAIGALTRHFAVGGDYPFRERRLGRAQMNLLYQLSRTNGLGIGELAAVLAVTSGAVSQSVDTLKKASLVSVDVDPRDARARIVSLTDRARSEVDAFQRGYIEAMAPQFAAMSTHDLYELGRLLSLVQPAPRSDALGTAVGP